MASSIRQLLLFGFWLSQCTDRRLTQSQSLSLSLPLLLLLFATKIGALKVSQRRRLANEQSPIDDDDDDDQL